MRALIAVVLLASCAALPRPVAARMEAEHRYRSCLSGERIAIRRTACIAESRDYCQAQGLPSDCGTADSWTRAVPR